MEHPFIITDRVLKTYIIIFLNWFSCVRSEDALLPLSAVLVKKLELNVRRLLILEAFVFGYFLCHDKKKKKLLMIILFWKVYWASRPNGEDLNKPCFLSINTSEEARFAKKQN